MNTRQTHFELYREGAFWRWRLRAANGQIIAVSGESYFNRADCEGAIALVQREAPTAPIEDLAPRRAQVPPPPSRYR